MKIFEKINNLVITHFMCILFFTFIYMYLLTNFSEHFLPSDDKVPHNYYLDNSFLVALFFALNIETSTGYIDVICVSTVSRLAFTVQLIISYLITLNTFMLLII
jgi:hypothetical protein